MTGANEQPSAPWGAGQPPAQPVTPPAVNTPTDPYSSSPLDYNVPPPAGYYQRPGFYVYPPQIQPHRSDTLKLLAILGFVMWIVALVALIMANQDLAAMQTGKMDPSGYTEAQNAKSLAKIALIVHGCLFGFGMVMWFVMMSVMMTRAHP